MLDMKAGSISLLNVEAGSGGGVISLLNVEAGSGGGVASVVGGSALVLLCVCCLLVSRDNFRQNLYIWLFHKPATKKIQLAHENVLSEVNRHT